jgi:hypothetical protein
MHRALTERGIERGSASYVLAGESLDVPVVGRLVERGLDDELKGSAYAVVDGVDGRTHHIRLPHLDAAGDSPPGSIVELRAYEDAQGQRRVALAVRSDLDLGAQVNATGATWLDRQAIAREPVALSEGGFGSEVRQAMEERAEHLIGEGLADRQGGRIVFARNLLNTLRDASWMRSAKSSPPRPALPFAQAADRRICRRLLSPALCTRLRPLRHDRRRPRLPARALVALARKADRPPRLRRRARRRRRRLGFRSEARAGPLNRESVKKGLSPCPQPRSSGARS